MDKPCKAPSYMTDYRCVGPECPDSCCTQWNIRLYPEDVQRLRSQLDDAENYINASPQGVDGAALQMDAAHECRLLDAGWCRVQKAFGEQGLPTVCCTFPRNVMVFSDHMEIHGSLACPEVVRCCLKEPAVSMMAPFPQHQVPPRLNAEMATDPRDRFLAVLPALANLSRDLMAADSPGEAEKVFLLAHLMGKLSPHVFRGMPPEGLNEAPKQMDALRDDHHQEKVLGFLTGIEYAPADSLDLIRNLLIARLQLPCSDRARQIIHVAVANLFEVPGGIDLIQAANIPAARLRTRIVHRLELARGLQAEIDHHLTKMAAAFFNPWQFSQDGHPWFTLQKWAAIRAMVRFLLFLQPEIGEATGREAPALPEETWLAAKMADIAQSVVKYFDQHPTMNQVLLQTLQGIKQPPLLVLGKLLKI